MGEAEENVSVLLSDIELAWPSGGNLSDYEWSPDGEPHAALIALPLLLVTAAVCLHTVTARVLWVVAVRCRFGTPAAGDLLQVLLTVSAACLLLLLARLALELSATSANDVSSAVCVISNGLLVTASLLLRLMVIFAALRVCLNRQMARTHRRWMVASGVAALLFAIFDVVFWSSGICYHQPLIHAPWMLIVSTLLHMALVLVQLVTLIVALCAVRMRRRRNPATEFQSAEVDGEAGDEPQSHESITSPEFVIRTENLTLVVAGTFLVREILFVVVSLAGYYFGHNFVASYITAYSFDIILLGVCAVPYFFMFPGFRTYAKKCFLFKT